MPALPAFTSRLPSCCVCSSYPTTTVVHLNISIFLFAPRISFYSAQLAYRNHSLASHESRSTPRVSTRVKKLLSREVSDLGILIASLASRKESIMGEWCWWSRLVTTMTCLQSVVKRSAAQDRCSGLPGWRLQEPHCLPQSIPSSNLFGSCCYAAGTAQDGWSWGGSDGIGDASRERAQQQPSHRHAICSRRSQKPPCCSCIVWYYQRSCQTTVAAGRGLEWGKQVECVRMEFQSDCEQCAHANCILEFNLKYHTQHSYLWRSEAWVWHLSQCKSLYLSAL